MSQNSEVWPHSVDELRRIFKAYTLVDDYILDNKSHLEYLGRYLANIGARTIVVECNYIDGDYLDDFAEYYVRCFHSYSHNCARLHFFKYQFDSQQFIDYLSGNDEYLNHSILSESYLGFVVLKPLP